MKNRKRESCTSGTVRDEDGNILIYSARNAEPIHALRRPASEKRQGTKSRWVGHGGCSKHYGELAAALVGRRSGGSGRRDRFGSEDGGRCWYKPVDRTVHDQIGGASAGQSDRAVQWWALLAVIQHE
jgi:hypothetical protein